MRRIHLLALIAFGTFVSSPVAVRAQARIGSIDLTIGTTKVEVLSSLGSSYQVDSTSGTWLVMPSGGNKGDALGYLRFAEDRLITVSRDWTPENNDDARAVVEAAINALASVSESSDEPCELLPEDQTQPGTRFVRIEIRCGFRGVTITAVDHDAGDAVSVSEFWRAFAEQNY